MDDNSAGYEVKVKVLANVFTTLFGENGTHVAHDDIIVTSHTWCSHVISQVFLFSEQRQEAPPIIARHLFAPGLHDAR